MCCLLLTARRLLLNAFHSLLEATLTEYYVLPTTHFPLLVAYYLSPVLAASSSVLTTHRLGERSNLVVASVSCAPLAGHGLQSASGSSEWS